MAMTLRLPPDLDAALRIAAEEDHRSLHSEIVHALELFLTARETDAILADPDALRDLAEARQAVRDGNIVVGVDDVRALAEGRRVS